jgi:hypothetical protein
VKTTAVESAVLVVHAPLPMALYSAEHHLVVGRAARFIQMDDTVIQQAAVIPVVWRNGVDPAGARLHGIELAGWSDPLIPPWKLDPRWAEAG